MKRYRIALSAVSILVLFWTCMAFADTTAGDRYISCTYRHYCAECHEEGLNGAPRTGDHVAWQPRLEQDIETLVQHALYGWHGKKGGLMPARGGHPELTNAEVTTAVENLVSLSQAPR